MTRNCLSALPSLDPRLAEAQRILICCDFDGTLCPLADSPAEVRLAPSMLEMLRRVAACERMRLAIVSGRALGDLARRAPVDGAILAGNHGLELCGGGLRFEHECARPLHPFLERSRGELATLLKPWPAAWIEDKALSLTVHYRAAPASQRPEIRRAVRRHIAGRNPLIGLRAASNALEVYPKIGWDKGAALGYVREQLGPFDLVIAIGDDYTDEDMFRECPRDIAIRVGAAWASRATLHLRDTASVAIFLQHVWDVRQLRSQWQPAGAAGA